MRRTPTTNSSYSKAGVLCFVGLKTNKFEVHVLLGGFCGPLESIKVKLRVIIFIVVLTGCGQNNHNRNKVETERQTTEMFTQVETHKDSSKFPDWLSKLYPGEIKLRYQTIRQELTDFKKVNDSVVYCTYKQMDGVCIICFLQTYVHKKQRDNLEIGRNCDHDLSRPSYSWKEFEIQSSNIILTNEYTESVHDSIINEYGHIKKEYDFFEAEKTVDTARQVFQVNYQGLIKEIKK